MQNDEIDEMLTHAVPLPHPGRWRGLDAESSRSLTQDSANRSTIGHFEGDGALERTIHAVLASRTPLEHRRDDDHSNAGR